MLHTIIPGGLLDNTGLRALGSPRARSMLFLHNWLTPVLFLTTETGDSEQLAHTDAPPLIESRTVMDELSITNNVV